jgi:hypothetical protein
MSYDMIIFGGGISGLTIAHEMINNNFKVLLIEKDNQIGGMAKSRREKNNIPSEHSWRGYAPFYKNTFQILKQIPFNKSLTVFDNLTKPIEFYNLRNKVDVYKPKFSFMDNLIIFYFGLKYLISNNRRNSYYKHKIEPFMKKNLTKDGYDLFINFIVGPGYGMNKHEVSYGHLFHFPILSYLNKSSYTHTHKENDKNNKYQHQSTDGWHVMNAPTNEAWFNPWLNYLKNKGLDVMLNTELVKLNYLDNNISSCIIKKKDNISQIHAKDYIIALNSFNAETIFKNSLMDNLHNKFYLLNKNTYSKQISFRIGINKNIEYPIQNIAFVMSDSEFNITWYPQEKHWKNHNLNINSLWSGTIIDFNTKGLLYNKTAIHLSKDELKNEIIYQILRSNSFQKLIYENNNFIIHKKDIKFVEIWYEWKFINGVMEQEYKKWVNNSINEKYRPSQQTNYCNLFLSGAHTKTSINIWSMEGAIESGKLTSNLLLNKYNKSNVSYYKHTDPSYITPFKYIDDLLYTVCLPNLIDLIIIVVLIIILYKNLNIN